MYIKSKYASQTITIMYNICMYIIYYTIISMLSRERRVIIVQRLRALFRMNYIYIMSLYYIASAVVHLYLLHI